MRVRWCTWLCPVLPVFLVGAGPWRVDAVAMPGELQITSFCAPDVTRPLDVGVDHNGGYFACSGSAADAERDCRGRPDSWHGGLTNEPGPLPGSRNLANHGAPIDAYYATSRQAKVRLCARDGSATGYAGSVHIMHSGVLPAAKRAAITPAPPLSPDGLPAPSRTRITAAAGTVPAAGRDDGAFRPGRR